VIAVATVVASAGLGRADTPLTQGSAMYTAGMPTGTSPDTNMNQYAVTVNYFLNGKDPSGGLGMATVPVPNIPATAGLPTPTAAQVAAASAAKAMAIVNAINGAKLPGVMAAVDANTMAGKFDTGTTEEYKSKLSGKTYTRPVLGDADFTTYTVSGVRQSNNPNNGNLGEPVVKTAVDAKGKPSNANVTGEIGNGKGGFTPAGKKVGMFQGTDSGNGALASVASGMDASGFASVVGFGFIDETTSTPTDYLEAIVPQAGMTDQDVLSGLADVFNSDYESSGYTASYDPTTDTLSVNQELAGVDELWSADSDTGLNLESNTVVPEPVSLSLLIIGGAAMLWRPRNRA
jgi:hypothetical protein